MAARSGRTVWKFAGPRRVSSEQPIQRRTNSVCPNPQRAGARMRHPKPLARSALGSAAEGTLLGSAPCKPGQPRNPTRRNLRAKTSPPLNHRLRGPTDDCPPLPPARPKQCRPTLHGHSLNAASHDLRTSDTSDKIDDAPLCRSSFKKATYRALDLQSREQPRRCLEVMTPDPVLAEASAAGVLPQRELEKSLYSGRLWLLRRSGGKLN